MPCTRNAPEIFEALEKVGFRVNVLFGDPAYHMLERLGGHYYMDLGCSAKIADGQ